MCNIHEFTCSDSVLISFSFFFAVDVIVDSLEGHFNMMKFAFSSLCVDLTVSRRDRKYVVAAVRTATGEQGLTESMSAILVRRKVASKKKKKHQLLRKLVWFRHSADAAIRKCSPRNS